MNDKLTPDQIAAYNEMGQLLMTSLGISSEKASEMIEEIMTGMLESLESGILKN